MARQRWLMMQAPQQRFPCASIKRNLFSILNRALCEYLFWPNEPFARQLVLDCITAIIRSCVWHTKYTCADILSTTHRLLMRWQHTATYYNTLQHTATHRLLMRWQPFGSPRHPRPVVRFVQERVRHRRTYCVVVLTAAGSEVSWCSQQQEVKCAPFI